MKTTDYAAFVGLDWGDKTHAFALQLAATDSTETGMLAANAETFHSWLDQLHVRCDGRRAALAIEAGCRAMLFAMAEHPWLDVFVIHPATCARFRGAFRPSGAKDDIPDAKTLLTIVTQHRDKLELWRMDSAPTRELAALVLGICPPRCIMVGDAENGYDAGHGRTDEDGMESAEAIHG